MAKSSRPERARSITKVVGRRLSSRCKSVAFRSFECKKQTKQTRLRVLVLSFPLFRLSRSDNLPRGLVLACGGRRPPRACGSKSGVANSTAFAVHPGDVAQLGEHLLCKQGVSGSSPLISTSTLTTELGLSRSPECRKAISGSSF